MNNNNERPRLFPSLPKPHPGKHRDAAQGLAVKGLNTIERAVTDFVAALPVIDMAFLLLVITYVKTA